MRRVLARLMFSLRPKVSASAIIAYAAGLPFLRRDALLSLPVAPGLGADGPLPAAFVLGSDAPVSVVLGLDSGVPLPVTLGFGSGSRTASAERLACLGASSVTAGHWKLTDLGSSPPAEHMRTCGA